MTKYPIVIRAKSGVTGVVAHIIGGVRNGESYAYRSMDEARAHLKRNNWEIIKVIKNDSGTV